MFPGEVSLPWHLFGGVSLLLRFTPTSTFSSFKSNICESEPISSSLRVFSQREKFLLWFNHRSLKALHPLATVRGVLLGMLPLLQQNISSSFLQRLERIIFFTFYSSATAAATISLTTYWRFGLGGVFIALTVFSPRISLPCSAPSISI